MRQKALQTRPRIAVKLDAGIVFEAMLLKRLEELPGGRREEWLRTLLLKGFQRECRELRKLNCQQPRHSSPASQQGASEFRSTDRGMTSASHEVAEQDDSGGLGDEPAQPATIVSLAALRRVIGQD